MSEPEISRRCSECGASMRAGAGFCQQCGKGFAREAKTAPDSDEKRLQNAAAPQRETNTAEREKKRVESAAATGSRDANVVSTAAQHSRVSVHRATAAAREVIEENVRPRVEKLRHVSSVVLDEAGYDPSLRFVLVAVVLFLLFLVLFFLNKWLG